MSAFLTPTELVDMTCRRRVDAQARALDAMGIVYKRRHDGSLVVLKAHAEAVLGLDAGPRKMADREPQLRSAR